MASQRTDKYKRSDDDMDTNKSREVHSPKTKIKLSIPAKEIDLRNSYLVDEHAILNNLPKLNLQLIDEHSYVSIIHVIVDFLGKGNLPVNIHYVENNSTVNLSDSVASRDMYIRARLRNIDVLLNNLLVLQGIQRSADFDPNSSSKKATEVQFG